MKMNRSLKKIPSALVLFALLFSLAPATLAASDKDPDASASRLLNWEVTGPLGGDVRSLVVDPRDPERLYFGTIDGQIYTTTDGGQNWLRLEAFNHPGLLVDNLIIDPRDSQTIYAAAQRHKETGGFFKTTDGGKSWREAGQLKGVDIHALTQSSKNPDIMLAGTSKGVWRSDDAGETWRQLDTSATPGLIDVESLAVDPRNTDVFYAGTWYLPYKSTDGGQSWKITKTGIIDDSDIFAISIDDRDSNHVIMSACSGIYETRNAGETWRKVNGIPSQSRRTRSILQNPARLDTIYAGTTEGFWMSTNGGGDWKVTTNRQSFEVNAIAVHPKNPDTVYIGTNNYGVMISHDGGRNFAPSNGGYSGRRAYAILADREKPGRIYATTINTATGGGYFYVSNDDGETWQLSARNMPSRLIAYSILQDGKDGNTIYLGTNYGLYRSTDRGASWSPVTASKPRTPARGRTRRGSTAHAATTVGSTAGARVASHHGTGRRVATRGSAARTASPEATHAEESAAPPTPTPSVAVRPSSNETVKRAQAALNLAGYDVGTPDGVAGTRTVSVLRKFQADKNIPVTGKFDAPTLVALGLAGGMQEAGAVADAMQSAPIFLTDTINALAYAGDEQDGHAGMLAATNAGLFRSYDLDKGWTRVPYGQGLDARTLCVSASAGDPQTILVGTSNSGVLVTHDAGKTWEQARGVPAEAPVNVIERDPKRPDNIYAGTTQTLYVSHDGGQHWLRRGGGLPLGSFTSVLVNPENPDEVFVGNAYERGGRVFSEAEGGGVFRSTDAGMSWQRLDPPLPSRRVWALAFDPRDTGKIFVGTHSAGVYVARRGSDAAATK
ncbi:MAG TPA: YCF48-related protein [Pyrinomonadaceae bacterium]|nr:YCF48-related protein [Pyrinomonadaceae bacterium]